jgi:NAD(P)H-flavin reductase
MTSHLGKLASSSATTSLAANPETKFPLTVEGPYGEASLAFPQFLVTGGAHRVLLFAGGVGATFAVPIYNALIADWPSTKVKLVWAIRAAADATWAVTLPPSSSSAASAAEDRKSLLDDDNVQLFLTGDMGSDTADAPLASASGVQMSDMRRQNTRRPDITKIVDDTFRLGQAETVAVMVCGPLEMTQDVRKAVRPWVMRGRNVWWHDETFGW